MAKRRVIFYLIFMLIGVGVVESYGYFTWEEKISGNKISVGKYEDNKFEVRMYASIGPLYENAMSENHSSAKSNNYINWFINTGRYIVAELENKPVQQVTNEKARFENILDGEGMVTPKATISSLNFSSWMGKLDDGKENGSMIHFVLTLNNKAKDNINRDLIYCRNIRLAVRQYDIYKDEGGNRYELYQRSTIKDLIMNFADTPYLQRLKTFRWEEDKFGEKKYMEQSNNFNGADLVVFDIGSRPNVSYKSAMDSENGLLEMYEIISGLGDHYSNGKSKWSEYSYMNYHTSPSNKEFQFKDSPRAKLIGIKTEVTVIYDGEVVEKLEPYIINIGEEGQEE